MHLIDSHCHLAKFLEQGTLPDILARAEDAGVQQWITVGTSIEDWATYRDLAAQYRNKVFWTVGIHPCDVDADWADQAMSLAAWFTDECPPVALGEIGLDYFHLPKDKDEQAEVIARQQEAFAHQLSIAFQLDCPVVVHSRHAFNDCVKMIDDSGVDWKRVVFHCFAEGAQEVAVLNERGGWASFTGIVTYKNAQTVRDALLKQGLAKVIMETDAPFLAPVPHRGKPCEPAYVRDTAAFCAEQFGISLEEFAEIATSNTQQFFNLPG